MLFGLPVLELIVLISAVFSLVAAIFGFEMHALRDAIAILFVIYGFICFPYKREDQLERVGLGTGCIIIILSGIVSYFAYSWWFLPFALLGYFVPLQIQKIHRTRGLDH